MGQQGILGFRDSPQVNAPEAYPQFTPGLIARDGEVPDETTAQLLHEYMEELRGFIERVYTVPPRGT